MTRMKIALGLLLLCLALSGQEVEDYGLSPEQMEDKLLLLVNQERNSRGLPALGFDPLLRVMARAHSQKMISENKLGHDFPGYELLDERAAKAGVYFSKVGENVARSETFVVRFFHEALLASPEHRENILDRDFTHLGVGIEKSAATYFVTQEFGSLFVARSPGRCGARAGKKAHGPLQRQDGPARERRQRRAGVVPAVVGAVPAGAAAAGAPGSLWLGGHAQPEFHRPGIRLS